jgi:hypothetical protein
MNATAAENLALRARLRQQTPRGAVLEADRPRPKAPPEPFGVAAAAASVQSSPPRALPEWVKTSTEFNQARAQAIATNRQIILTFVNRVRFDFATTWVSHVRSLGLSNWLVGATDRTALRELKRQAIPCFDMSTNLPEGEWPWGSPSFKALGPHKIELIYKAISWVGDARAPEGLGNVAAHSRSAPQQQATTRLRAHAHSPPTARRLLSALLRRVRRSTGVRAGPRGHHHGH